MLKRLPLNTRASDYAAKSGFNPAPTFYGDVYLGRVRQHPALKNVSFYLGADTAPDAPWLKAAVTENLEYQLEMNKITGRSDIQQPSVAGSDGKAKEEDGYTWTQTETELEVVVLLPSDAVSKQVAVKFNPHKLNVSYQKEPKVSLQLFERVDVDSCTWTLESGSDTKKLVITLEKLEEAYWPRIRD
jgi:CS domain